MKATHLAADNLEAALEHLPRLGPIDDAAFRATSWAWRSRSRMAYCARWWSLRGLRPRQGETLGQ